MCLRCVIYYWLTTWEELDEKDEWSIHMLSILFMTRKWIISFSMNKWSTRHEIEVRCLCIQWIVIFNTHLLSYRYDICIDKYNSAERWTISTNYFSSFVWLMNLFVFIYSLMIFAGTYIDSRVKRLQSFALYGCYQFEQHLNVGSYLTEPDLVSFFEWHKQMEFYIKFLENCIWIWLKVVNQQLVANCSNNPFNSMLSLSSVTDNAQN